MTNYAIALSISELGDIGSFITALISLITLVVLLIQTRSAYEADIGVANGNEMVKFKPEHRDDNDEYTFHKDWIEQVNLRLFNIGFGSAKKVKVSIIHDYENLNRFFQSFIEKLNLEGQYRIEEAAEFYGFYQGNEMIEHHTKDNDPFVYLFNFIVPHKGIKEASMVPLPSSIMFFLFCASYIVNKNRHDIMYAITMGKYDPIQIEVRLEYFNVTGTKKKATFLLDAHFFVDEESPKIKFLTKKPK